MKLLPISRLSVPVMCFLSVLALASCGGDDGQDENRAEKQDPRAELDAQLADLMTRFGDAVGGIRDEAGWEKSEPNIRDIIAAIPPITAQLRQLPKPSGKEFSMYSARTKSREAALEEALGDQTEFLSKLPPAVAQELRALAGEFSVTMGDAQTALLGPRPGAPAAPGR